MKSRFLIFTTLVLTVLCISSASNTMAQSVSGTAVIGSRPFISVTVSARADGNGGVLRLGQGQTEAIAHPIDICVQDNTAYVVAQITHTTGGFAGTEGQFLHFGFVDNGSGAAVLLVPEGVFGAFPTQVPACDLFSGVSVGLEVSRGSYQVKP
jgi:hypothetical protein